MSQCRSCHAPIIWAQTENHRSMPVDAAPDHVRGNVELLSPPAGMTQPLARVHKQPPMVPEGPLHTSHFATCPYAKDHRKDRPSRGRPR